jgi:hypothetical protein
MARVTNQVINLGVEAGQEMERIGIKKQTLDLSLRVYLLELLVEKLDPDHVYIFSPEYNAFIKEEKREKSNHTG